MTSSNCSDLTIFLISSGSNPNYFDALDALEAQTAVAHGARIEHVRNMAPMSAAFQAMIEKCQTRYYMQCFPPDTDILMGDMTSRPIGDIKVNDVVCCGNNQVACVGETFCRHYEGNLLCVTYAGNAAFPLRLTPDHPCFVIPERDKNRIVSYYRHVDGFVLADSVVVKKASELRVGDLLLSPGNEAIQDSPAPIDTAPYLHRTAKRRTAKPIPSSLMLDRPLMRLIGYYLAEGHVTYRSDGVPSGVEFTFNISEVRYHREVSYLMRRLFGYRVFKHPDIKNHGMRLSVFSFFVGEFFESFCGRGAANKRIPDVLMTAPTDLQRELVDTWWCGDGHYCRTAKDKIGVTISRTLAVQLATIYRRIGEQPRLDYQRNPAKKEKPHHATAYRISRPDEQEHGCRHWIYDTHGRTYLATPITKITSAPYAGPVCNLTVEKTHAYIANGVKVHNCDEDMILEPDAAEGMLTVIRKAADKVDGASPAFAVFLLHDTHLDMLIQGVKIYDHEIMAKYPYNLEIISCEKDQLDRLRADGHKILETKLVMGEHSPKWTPELIFERYFDLMEKWKLYGYSWLEDLPRKLLDKYLGDQTETNRYAFLGAWASASRPEKLRTREKDFRIRTPEFLRTRAWFSQPTQATLYLTDKCNLKCGWCLRQGDMAQVAKTPAMFDPWIVDELKVRFPSVTAVCLCGFGEPLLCPNLAEVIDRCKKHNLWIGIITNGTNLAGMMPLLLDHRPSSISISLNAATAAEHAEECGVPGAWDKIMRGLAAMREQRAVLRGAHSTDWGIPVFLSRVCTAQNFYGIPAFVKLAAELEVVAGVDLHNVLPHDVGTPEKEAAFLQQVLTVRHWETLDAMKLLPGMRIVRSWPVLIDPDAPVRQCNYPFQAISVDGARNVGFCNSVMPPNPENGELRDPKVWQNEYATALRQSFADEEVPTWCRWCFRNWC